MNNYLDNKIIQNELKLLSYNTYISCLFVDYQFRKKIILISYLEIQFKNILKNNLDENLIITKLDWWGITCSESIEGKYFSVPALRLLNEYFNNNNIIKNELLFLVKLLKEYCVEKSISKKIKLYSRCLLIKNNILCEILKIKYFNTNVRIALNFLILSKSFSEHNQKSLSIKSLNKAKELCKRPNKKFLIFFLLNSKNIITKRNILIKVFLLIFSIWY